jgi:hypothetical protein
VGRPEAKLRSFDAAHRLAAFVKQTAEEIAAQHADGDLQGDGGEGTSYEPTEQEKAEIERHAQRTFRVILEFAGSDLKLLEQAKAFVARTFGARALESGMKAEMARRIQDRVIELINQWQNEVTRPLDIDLSA